MGRADRAQNPDRPWNQATESFGDALPTANQEIQERLTGSSVIETGNTLVGIEKYWWFSKYIPSAKWYDFRILIMSR